MVPELFHDLRIIHRPADPKAAGFAIERKQLHDAISIDRWAHLPGPERIASPTHSKMPFVPTT
jgi:hypothetical protein